MIKLISIDERCQTESEPKRDNDAGGAGYSATVKTSRPILSRRWHSSNHKSNKKPAAGLMCFDHQSFDWSGIWSL